MAIVEVEGFEALDAMFKELADIPFDVTAAALNAMAAVGETALKRNGEAMGVRDTSTPTDILDNITHSKPKQTGDGGFCEVKFKGRRKRGNTVTQNALIAFENEYGNRSQAPRPFTRLTAQQDGDAISAPGEKILGDWMETTAAK